MPRNPPPPPSRANSNKHRNPPPHPKKPYLSLPVNPRTQKLYYLYSSTSTEFTVQLQTFTNE